MKDSGFFVKNVWQQRATTLGTGSNRPADWEFTRHSLGVIRLLSRTDL